MNWQSCLLKSFARSIVIGGWLISASNGSTATSEAAPISASEDIFSGIKIIGLNIRLEKAAIRALEDAPYSYVSAQVEEGGTVYSNVGLHLKGARTFQTLDRKPSLTLKFNEYMPQQSFHGRRKLLLNNAFEEKTFVQERLGQDLFRAVGTPTPGVNYARVRLNGRDLGLYVLVEGITKDFLERSFGSAKGNLYEGAEEDIDGELEQDYGKRSRRGDLQPLINATRERDRAKRFEQMQRCLNVDQFIAYIALETMINVWDGYSMRRNNYRIYCDHTTGRVTFIPHGLDNFFVESEAPLLPEMKGMVSTALLDTPEGNKRYLQKCQEIYATVLKKEDLHHRVDELAAHLKPALTELGSTRTQANALASYYKRIDRRLEYIGESLPKLIEGASRAKKPSP